MYSFGNKKKHGEKAKPQATRERVAPTQTMILSEKQLEDLTDLIYNQMRDKIFHKPRWEAPDLKPVNPKKQVNNRGRSLLFSGNRKDPEVYLQWESDMEKWLQFNKIPKELELSQVVSAFTGKAHEWWLKENPPTIYKKSVLDWRGLKARMHEEFVGQYQSTPNRVTPISPSVKEHNIKRHAEDTKDSILQTINKPKQDIRPINRSYKPDPEELSNKSTCSRNLTHQGITEKKNWIKIVSHEGDIQLPTRQTTIKSEEDHCLPIEGSQKNQDEPSCKPTCFVNLILQRSMSNWIHVQIPYGLKVIQLINQEMLGLPYLKAYGFNHLQTRIWRPGEEYNHSRDISNHPEGSSINLESSDLRTNPFKGGGDGAISISLNFKFFKINNESSNQDHFHQIASYYGDTYHAKTQLVHAKSEDGRISLLPNRNELVRPPEQLQDAILVFDDSRHVLAHPNTINKFQKAQEDTKDELGLLKDEPNKMRVEQGPYWPMKLKDRPPWVLMDGYGPGPSIRLN